VDDFILGLLDDLFGDLIWKWPLKPVLIALLVRPFRWLVVRPIRLLLTRRRLRRELEAQQVGGQQQFGLTDHEDQEALRAV